MRILGIDYGDKKIGLAFGESDAQIAMPLDVVPNLGEDLIKFFLKKIEAEDIELIVVGAPFKVGAHHSSKQLEKTEKFIKDLEEATTIPIVVEDESYTTVESIRLQREEGALAQEDALAAMLILQGYLDKIKK